MFNDLTFSHIHMYDMQYLVSKTLNNDNMKITNGMAAGISLFICIFLFINDNNVYIGVETKS